jgi:Meiotically up-regulated gene 113
VRRHTASKEEVWGVRGAAALLKPPATWIEMREALDAIDEAVRYAKALACRRGDSEAMRELAMQRRRTKKVEAMAHRGSNIYVVKRPDRRLVKIGVTDNVHRRVKSLQTAAGCELELLLSFPGEREDEQLLHKEFAEYRQRGEWFTYARPLALWVHEKRLNG